LLAVSQIAASNPKYKATVPFHQRGESCLIVPSRISIEQFSIFHSLMRILSAVADPPSQRGGGNGGAIHLVCNTNLPGVFPARELTAQESFERSKLSFNGS
jgi:hypothetical protein